MKRFTFKGVLDNFRQSVSQPTKAEQSELVETLKADHCQLARVSDDEINHHRLISPSPSISCHIIDLYPSSSFLPSLPPSLPPSLHPFLYL